MSRGRTCLGGGLEGNWAWAETRLEGRAGLGLLGSIGLDFTPLGHAPVPECRYLVRRQRDTMARERWGSSVILLRKGKGIESSYLSSGNGAAGQSKAGMSTCYRNRRSGTCLSLECERPSRNLAQTRFYAVVIQGNEKNG